MTKPMQSISTKTGDAGETGLANGQRVPKDSPVIELIGTIDELNSWLGLVVAELKTEVIQDIFSEQRQFLLKIQDRLFYLGAEVAQSPTTKLSEEALSELETRAEALQASMEDQWHSKFLLPGGTKLGGYLDLARAVCRRCERLAVAYRRQAELSAVVLRYINRLSDYLYLLRTVINAKLDYREQQFEAQK